MIIGKKHWVIPEGYIPAAGPHAHDPALRSHETACILNMGPQPAQVSIHLYFTDRDPIGPYRVIVPARRTLHLRFDELSDPEPVPRETDYASVLDSDRPIVVQHTRLDARLGSLALLSTIAFAQP